MFALKLLLELPSKMSYSTTMAGTVAPKLSSPVPVVMLVGAVPPVVTENAVFE